MTNTELLLLAEGEYQITNDISYHTLKIVKHLTKKKLLYIIKPQFGHEKIWLEPKKKDYDIESWVMIGGIIFSARFPIRDYKILENASRN